MKNQVFVWMWNTGKGQVSKLTCDTHFSTFGNVGVDSLTGCINDIDSFKISNVGVNLFLLSRIHDIELVGIVK